MRVRDLKNKITDKMMLPVKGENIIATFEYGQDEVLRCSSLAPIGKIKPKKINLERMIYNKNYKDE